MKSQAFTFLCIITLITQINIYTSVPNPIDAFKNFCLTNKENQEWWHSRPSETATSMMYFFKARTKHNNQEMPIACMTLEQNDLTIRMRIMPPLKKSPTDFSFAETNCPEYSALISYLRSQGNVRGNSIEIETLASKIAISRDENLHDYTLIINPKLLIPLDSM